MAAARSRALRSNQPANPPLRVAFSSFAELPPASLPGAATQDRHCRWLSQCGIGVVVAQSGLQARAGHAEDGLWSNFRRNGTTQKHQMLRRQVPGVAENARGDDWATRPDTARIGGWAAMSVFGASRFTAVLAAVALSGTVGTFWWAIQARSDSKAAPGNGSAHRALSSKLQGRPLRPPDPQSNKFELMGRSERAQTIPPGWSDDRVGSPERPVAPEVLVNYANPGLEDGRADMPLPTPPAQFDPASWPAKTPERPVVAAPLPAENPQRQARESRPEPAATPQPPKSAARSYYVEKVVEQSDAGQVKSRYRRRSCEPPNMPDVCFMPQANRRGIVVERR
jgi:hypothetical protein